MVYVQHRTVLKYGQLPKNFGGDISDGDGYPTNSVDLTGMMVKDNNTWG